MEQIFVLSRFAKNYQKVVFALKFRKTCKSWVRKVTHIQKCSDYNKFVLFHLFLSEHRP